MGKTKVFFAALLVVLVIGTVGYAEALIDDTVMAGLEKNNAANVPTISPQYSYTKLVQAGLEFSGGKAICTGKVSPLDEEDVTITVTLYKKNGTKWNYITSWSGSATGGHTATAGGSISVDHGTYKVVTIGNVGGLEWPSAKTEKTY